MNEYPLILAVDPAARFIKAKVVDPVTGTSEMLKDENGNDFHVAAYFNDGGTEAFGIQAMALGELDPENLCLDYKPSVDDETRTFGRARPMTARQIMVRMIEHLNRLVEAAYGQKATQSACSLPSKANEAKHRVMFAIFGEAGVPIIPEGKGGVGCIPESMGPVVSVEFKRSKNFDLSKMPPCARAVVDVGHSSTDIASVLILPGQIKAVTDGGDTALGGMHLSAAMLDWVIGLSIDRGIAKARDWEKLNTVPALKFEMDKRIDEAKRGLSSAAEYTFPIPVGKTGKLKLKREEFEQKVIKPFAERVLQLLMAQMAEALPVIKAAGCELKELIVTGGTCRNPFLREYISKGSGLTIMSGTDPMHENVNGVALHAMSLIAQRKMASGQTLPLGVKKLKLVSAFDIGIIVSPDRSRPDYCVSCVVILHGQPVPTSVTKPFGLFEDNQSSVHFRVVQCSGDNQLESECHLLGETQFTNLPPGPAADRFDVTVSYDSASMVTVEIVERLSGQRRVIEITIDPQSRAA